MYNSKTMVDYTMKQLAVLGEELPFEVGYAWADSSPYVAHYLQEHVNNGAGLDTKQAALLATGRFDWLLRESRPTLSGLFSEADIITLVNCFHGMMFSPHKMHCIASDLCDDLGIELEDYEISRIAVLLDKLNKLDTLQRVALADALEQTWYRGLGIASRQPREFLSSIGINLL
jgi:hypothetical protein